MSRLDRPLFAGAVVLALAPIIAAAISVAGQEWYPASDVAIQLLQIDDVGGPHTPLTGAHSRYGWDHPGPLQSWLLAPFDWLFGVNGVLVGVALLNAAAIVGALVVARRRGGVTLAVLVALVVLVLTLANGTDLFVNPWNPWVAVLPFFTYLLLAWSLADGDVVVLPWLVGVGTYIVQAHVSYAPLVLGAGLVAVADGVALAAGARRRRRCGLRCSSRWRRSGCCGCRRSSSSCSPTTATSPRSSSSSATRPRRKPDGGWRGGSWAPSSDRRAPGWRATSSVRSACCRAPPCRPCCCSPGWSPPVSSPSRRGVSSSAGRLALLVVAACAFGVVATSRITGLIGTYLVRWWWVLAAVVWLSISWSVMCLLTERRARQGAARRRGGGNGGAVRGGDGARRACWPARP